MGHPSQNQDGVNWTAEGVFSSMTSFTQCSGTSFTLPRERSERGGAIKDDVEECGHSGTTRAVRGGGESAGEDIRGSLSGVRGISTHGIFVAAALSGTGAGRHRRAQPSAACQSAADRRRVGAAGGGTAATLSGLGSAQTAGATSAGGSELAGEHHSSHSIASGVGADRGSACGGVAALRAGRAQPTLADGFQRLHGVGNGGGTVVGARRSQPLSDRPARDLDDESRTRAGAAGIGLFGVWRAGGDADGSWHAVEERKRADGGELADGVVDAARHRVALERIPASANPGESGTFSWLAATGARTAGRARRTTAAVARSVSPRIQPSAATRSPGDADSGQPVAPE